MLNYERLPENNVEVAGLLHALGYSNDWQLLNKYKLKYSTIFFCAIRKKQNPTKQFYI